MHRFVLSAGVLGVAQARVEWITQFNPQEESSVLLTSSDVGVGFGKERSPEDYPRCKWPADDDPTGFKYDITSASSTALANPLDPSAGTFQETRDVCFPNIFADKHSLYYPYPRSSYNYDLDPAWPSPLGEKPRVEVDIEYDASSTYTTNKKTVDAVDYKTFESTGPTILYNAVPKGRGTYFVDVKAFDFDSRASIDCSTCFVVNDLFRPKGNSGQCPASPPSSGVFSSATVKAYESSAKKVVDYSTSATNNACSDDRCDTVYLKQTGIASASATTSFESKTFGPLGNVPGNDLTKEFVQAKWTTCMAQPFSNDEWTDLIVSPIPSDGGAPQYKSCKRTCAIGVALKEWFTEYTCEFHNPLQASRKQCVGDAAESCDFEQSLSFPNGNALVQSVDVRLKVQTTGPFKGKSSVKTIIHDPSAVFGDAAKYASPYSSHEIHFDPECTTRHDHYDTFCNHRVLLNDVFAFTGKMATDAAVQALFAAAPNARDVNEIVFWTFTVDETGTQAVTPTTELTLTKFKTKVTFQAHTACGAIANAVEWTLYVHRHERIVVTHWLNGLFSTRDDGCNVEGSDFGVVAFKYSPAKDGDFTVNDPSNPLVAAALLEDNASSDVDYTPVGQENTIEILGHADPTAAREDAAVTTTSSSGEASDAVHADDGGVAPTDSDASSTVDEPPSVFLANSGGDNKDEVMIQWFLRGMKGVWQYNSVPTASAAWIDTLAVAGAQGAVSQEFAIKLQNAETTKAKAIFDFMFQSRASLLTMKLETVATDTFTMQNCDYPRFNVAHPSDQGRFVKDTCDKTSWEAFKAGGSSWQPAPFQACGGVLVFPTGGDAKATVLENEGTPLTCCNDKALSEPFTCQRLKDTSSIYRCSDDPVIATLYQRDGYNQGNAVPQSFGVGESDVRDKQTSSMKLVKGYELIGYKTIVVAGKPKELFKTWIGDVGSFERGSDATSWNGKITRVKVQKVSPGNVVQFFAEAGYRGAATMYGATAVSSGVPDVRSFHLQDGYEILLYRDKNFKSYVATYSRDVPDLDFVKFQSFQVTKATPPLVAATVAYIQHAPAVALVVAAAVVAVVVKRRQATSTHIDVEAGYVSLIH